MQAHTYSILTRIEMMNGYSFCMLFVQELWVFGRWEGFRSTGLKVEEKTPWFGVQNFYHINNRKISLLFEKIFPNANVSRNESPLNGVKAARTSFAIHRNHRIICIQYPKELQLVYVSGYLG